MPRSSQEIVEKQVKNRLDLHFVNLNNAVQQFITASPRHRAKLVQGIRFHLYKVSEHKDELAVVSGWRKRELLFQAVALTSSPLETELTFRVRQLNRMFIENDYQDSSVFGGILSERSRIFGLLPATNVLRLSPWMS